MLLTKTIEIRVNGRVVPHFRKLGYDVKMNSYLTIPIEHLNEGSKYKVNVRCDICGNISTMEYYTYLFVSKFDGKYYCRKNKCFMKKVELTTFEKYGVTNTSKSKEFQYKWISTNLERYGCENVFQSEIVKKKIVENNIKNGLQVPDEESYLRYRRLVTWKSLKFKKELFDIWDGFDYYDKEYIKENINLNHNNSLYPTIDHKMSVQYGFLNNIPIEEMSDISNLCITKRKNNSQKRTKNEQEFILWKETH